jgi:methyl-accepting chemotaxis protein
VSVPATAAPSYRRPASEWVDARSPVCCRRATVWNHAPSRGVQMDFTEAIRAHAEWKLRLSLYLRRPNGTLVAREVAADDRCVLGKWLGGEGLAHAALPGFGELRQAHARFHRAAADIVRRADAGESVLEDVALGGNSEYAQASNEITRLLMEMRSVLRS